MSAGFAPRSVCHQGFSDIGARHIARWRAAGVVGNIGGKNRHIIRYLQSRECIWRGRFFSVPTGALVALAAWLALASFFASSLARNFLQAVGFAIGTFIGLVMLSSALIDGRMFFLDSIQAHSILPVVIAIPTAIATLLWLAYFNFKNFRDGWPLWRRNLLGLAGACVFIVVMSATLYNRVWEIFRWPIRRFCTPTLTTTCSCDCRMAAFGLIT